MNTVFERLKGAMLKMPGNFNEEYEIVPEASFSNDLGIDELDYSELTYAIKFEFGLDVPANKISELSTVGELAMYIETMLGNNNSEDGSNSIEDNSIKFFQSIWDNDYELSKKILEKGINVNITTDDGWTPLLELCAEGPIELIKLLLENNADPNIASNQGYTPLMRAAGKGQAEIVKLLLEHGADFTMKDHLGQNASRMARAEFQFEIAGIIDEVFVKYLLEKYQHLSTEYHLHPLEPIIKDLVHRTRNQVGGYVHRLDVTMKNGETIKQCKVIEELVILLPNNLNESDIASYSIPYEQPE